MTDRREITKWLNERPNRPAPVEALAELLAEHDRLATFARDIMKNWPEGDVDGGELQDIAVKCGLLVPEERTEFCGERCSCEEYFGHDDFPFTCHRRSRIIGGDR